MSARQILNAAYTLGTVPPELHGRTQHKTLGARLSEDILIKRERSEFFRTSPGRFFLRKFLADGSLAEEFRTPFIARRRQRELYRGRHLAISRSWLSQILTENCVGARKFFSELSIPKYHYKPRPYAVSNQDCLVWSFVLVTKGDFVLTYRHGRYREDRDTFLKRRSIGFFTPVVDSDCDLFDRGDLGMVSAGLKAVIMDLDLPTGAIAGDSYESRADLEYLVDMAASTNRADLLAVIRFECPTWFEPLRRHLAINDLNWMELFTPINNIEDFDPWSQKVLDCFRQARTREKIAWASASEDISLKSR
jgi:hypothetical protein